MLKESIEKLHTSVENFTTNYETRLKKLEPKKENTYIDYLKTGDTKSLTGGEHLLPEHMVYRIFENLKEESMIRNLASIYKTDRDVFEIIRDDDEAHCGWVGDEDKREETELASFKKQVINIYELYAKPKISQKMIEDVAIDLENWVAKQIAYSMGIKENHAFLYGDGVNKPKGILADKNIYTVSGHSSDSLIGCQMALSSHYQNGAVWFMSPSTLAYIKLMKSTETGQYLWQPSLSQKDPQTFLGYPIVLCSQMQTLEDGQVSALFGNFKKGYQIVDRVGMNLMRDPYSAKPYVEFYARKRVGGDVIDPKAFVQWRFVKNQGAQNA